MTSLSLLSTSTNNDHTNIIAKSVSTTMVLIPKENSVHGQGRLFQKGANFQYGDFRDDLLRDGFAVVKGAIPRDRADSYADQMYSFLEDL